MRKGQKVKWYPKKHSHAVLFNFISQYGLQVLFQQFLDSPMFAFAIIGMDGDPGKLDLARKQFEQIGSINEPEVPPF